MHLSQSTDRENDPHRNATILAAGASIKNAQAAMLMLHGRGATAEDILSLTDFLDLPGFTFLAPQANNYTWYPYPFMTAIESNQPWLSSGLELINTIMGDLEQQGISSERVILLGFSQGACLALDYSARHARRYGGVAGLSGGLIGPAGTSWESTGTLQGTPIFLGCSDRDAHIPKTRVLETAEVMEALGGMVTTRIYTGMGHTVNQDELDQVQSMGSILLNNK